MKKQELNLIRGGVRPNWLGKKEDGTLIEFCSFPWRAGSDVFVLVQKPDKPKSAECIEVRNVEPLFVLANKESA
jgi:hypothetical protein